MSDQTPPPFFDALLKEFRDKVAYLKEAYRYEQKDIAASVDELPGNFQGYLGGKSVSREKLERLLHSLKTGKYSAELKTMVSPYPPDTPPLEGEDTLPRQIYSSLKMKVEGQGLLLEALRDLVLEEMARRGDRSLADLQEMLAAKIAALGQKESS